MTSKLIRLALAFACMLTLQARAFSLLGPYDDWMTPVAGYPHPGGIGGPMNLGGEFRWNVPIVTYGFDKSFVDYFGPDGVKAVEDAIKTLNQLPTASTIVPTNFPTDTSRFSARAAALNLYDLKSTTLSLLLEQMGLNHPAENVFVLRRWNSVIFLPFPDETQWGGFAIPYYVLERNFDPETYQPSHSVNDVLYTGTAGFYPYYPGTVVGPVTPLFPDILEHEVDPLAMGWSAVAEARLDAGEFYTGLTRDDVGGLRYLMRKDNFNYEPLLPSVQIPGQRAGDWMRTLARVASGGRGQSASVGPVRDAVRPGREHITFVRHPGKGNPRRWLPFSYQFTDRYVDLEGTSRKRRVKRTVAEPDILFCAANLQRNSEWPPRYDRAGTTNWIRATINTNGVPETPPPGGATYTGFPGIGPTTPDAEAGPGIISPSIKITFHKPIPVFSSGNSTHPQQFEFWFWGSFDNSTNPPVIYQELWETLSVRLRAYETNNSVTPVLLESFHVDVPVGRFALFQISSNQTDWTTVFDVLNSSGEMSEWEWRHYGNIFGPGAPASQLVFFRIVPAMFPSGPLLSLVEQRILIEAQRLPGSSSQGSMPPLPPTILLPEDPGGSPPIPTIPLP